MPAFVRPPEMDEKRPRTLLSAKVSAAEVVATLVDRDLLLADSTNREFALRLVDETVYAVFGGNDPGELDKAIIMIPYIELSWVYVGEVAMDAAEELVSLLLDPDCSKHFPELAASAFAVGNNSYVIVCDMIRWDYQEVWEKL